MPVKTITSPTGKQLKFGRNRPRARYPHLSLKNYLMRGVPSGPPEFDWGTKAATALSQMYDNNEYGCCVESEIAHHVGVFTGNATGTSKIFTSQNIISMYTAMGGYQPGDPSTDQGTDIPTALNIWQNSGLIAGQDKIVGYMAVDATDPVEVRTAAWIFGGICIGLELPDAWITPFPSASGFTWDVAGSPDPDNGHCILGCAYNTTGVVVCTWGMLGTMTYASLAEYGNSANGGEVYCILSQDWVNAAMKKAPTGYDFLQMQADLQAIGAT